MAKANVFTETAWTGPVHIVPLGWGLTATFVVLFVLCFLAALLFPNAELTHNWLSLYSTRPMGSLCDFWCRVGRGHRRCGYA